MDIWGGKALPCPLPPPPRPPPPPPLPPPPPSPHRIVVVHRKWAAWINNLKFIAANGCVQGSNFLIFCLLMIYKPLCNASAAVCTHFYLGIVALIFTLHLTCLALYCECCQSPLLSLFSCPLSSYTRLILNIIIPNDVYLQLCYHQFCFPTVAIWLVKP